MKLKFTWLIPSMMSFGFFTVLTKPIYADCFPLYEIKVHALNAELEQAKLDNVSTKKFMKKNSVYSSFVLPKHLIAESRIFVRQMPEENYCQHHIISSQFMADVGVERTVNNFREIARALNFANSQNIFCPDGVVDSLSSYKDLVRYIKDKKQEIFMDQ